MAPAGCRAPAAIPGWQSGIRPHRLEFPGEEQEGKEEPGPLPTAAVPGPRVPARRGARGARSPRARQAKEHRKAPPALRHLPDEKEAQIFGALLTSFSLALKSFDVSFNSPASERLLTARQAIYN